MKNEQIFFLLKFRTYGFEIYDHFIISYERSFLVKQKVAKDYSVLKLEFL